MINTHLKNCTFKMKRNEKKARFLNTCIWKFGFEMANLSKSTNERM